jgi:hypothetical protein
MKHLFLSFVLMCFGCNDAKDLDTSGGGGTSDSSAIEGEWMMACAASGSNFAEKTLDFSGSGALIMETHVYSDADCSTKLYSSEEAIDYWLIRSVESEDEKYHWNWESQSLSYKPSDAQATTWNTSGFCNYADWLGGKMLDRTNFDCHTTTLFFDLLKVDDDSLFLGDRTAPNNGTTNDKRPLVVSTAAYVRR